MTTRFAQHMAALAAAALLLAPPALSLAADAGPDPGLPPLPAADNAARSGFPPEDSTAVDSTPVAAGDNEATLPPPVPATDNAAGVSTSPAAGGEAPSTPEEPEMREPSFAAETPPAPKVADPIEPVNRGIFYVNDKLYRWVLKPVAKGYQYIVPEGARIAVRNFFYNIATPIRAVNALLQGKVKTSGTELARFGINSTVGFLGFFDAAKHWDLLRKDEDTGQTFGTWGIGNGFYLVLPVLGPSTARDTVGIVGDTFLDPTTYLLRPVDAVLLRAVRSENDLSLRINDYEELTDSAVDPYVAVRNAYIQHRAKLVRE